MRGTGGRGADKTDRGWVPRLPSSPCPRACPAGTLSAWLRYLVYLFALYFFAKLFNAMCSVLQKAHKVLSAEQTDRRKNFKLPVNLIAMIGIRENQFKVLSFKMP